MDGNSTVKRREALRVGAASVAAVTLAGCDLFSTEPEGTSESAGDSGTDDQKEAPHLARQVKSGKLPPREKRLPKDPLVVKPTERTGQYGGTWSAFITYVGASPFLIGALSYEPLVRWSVDGKKVVPGLAASWDIHGDGHDYVFHLRRGLKWSDGQPFGVDDIVFAYEDVLKNTALNPVLPDWLTGGYGGKPVTLEKVDEHTCRFTFSQPYGIFLSKIAADGTVLTSLPRHYLKDFHKSYNPDVNAQAKTAGFSDWVKFFQAKGGAGPGELGVWQNKDLPTMYPWRLVQPLTGANALRAERNPFYWKTDPQGRQLPYLDKVTFDLVKTPDVAILKLSKGEYSVAVPGIPTYANKPVLARNRTAGGYHFIDMVNSRMNFATFILNLTHPDPKMREMMQNKDFRIGLSYALNRPEIIKLVMQGQGKPWQTSPRPSSEFELKELGTQYTDYDERLANQHLDKAGYTGRDSDGFRTRPDGERVAFTLEVRTNFNPAWEDIAQLAHGYWKKVGVDARVRVEDATLLYSRRDANKHDAVMDDGDSGLLPILGPTWYFPYVDADSAFAVLWARWYQTKGKNGEKPPPGPRHQMEIYDELLQTADRKKQHDLFMQILKIAQEEFYVIGTALSHGEYNIVQNDFHNVADPMIDGSSYPEPGPTNPEQYFRET